MTIQQIEEIELKCNMCKVSKFITDEVRGEIICSSCGYVILEQIQDRFEPRNLSAKSDNARTGPGISLSMFDKGLYSIIGVQNRDSFGKIFTSTAGQKFSRLRKWDKRSQTKDSAIKSLKHALQLLNNLQFKLGLSDSIIERASLFYRKASDRGFTRGRTIKGISAACLYASCRDLGNPRTLAEIADKLEINVKEVGRTYRFLARELDFIADVPDPVKSICKLANKLGLKEKTKRKALDLLEKIRATKIFEGKNPEIVAATVVYAACVLSEENTSQNEIATVAGTSVVSIRHRFSDMKKNIDLLG